MATIIGDEIVEARQWISGAEIISRINWSHLARVRRALGVSGEGFAHAQFIHPALSKPAKRRPRLPLVTAGPRAA